MCTLRPSSPDLSGTSAGVAVGKMSVVQSGRQVIGVLRMHRYCRAVRLIEEAALAPRSKEYGGVTMTLRAANW